LGLDHEEETANNAKHATPQSSSSQFTDDNH